MKKKSVKWDTPFFYCWCLHRILPYVLGSAVSSKSAQLKANFLEEEEEEYRPSEKEIDSSYLDPLGKSSAKEFLSNSDWKSAHKRLSLYKLTWYISFSSYKNFFAWISPIFKGVAKCFSVTVISAFFGVFWSWFEIFTSWKTKTLLPYKL